MELIELEELSKRLLARWQQAMEYQSQVAAALGLTNEQTHVPAPGDQQALARHREAVKLLPAKFREAFYCAEELLEHQTAVKVKLIQAMFHTGKIQIVQQIAERLEMDDYSVMLCLPAEDVRDIATSRDDE